MRYCLRTLLIAMFLIPPALATAWFALPKRRQAYSDWQWREAAEAAKQVQPHGGGLVTRSKGVAARP